MHELNRNFYYQEDGNPAKYRNNPSTTTTKRPDALGKPAGWANLPLTDRAARDNKATGTTR